MRGVGQAAARPRRESNRTRIRSRKTETHRRTHAAAIDRREARKQSAAIGQQNASPKPIGTYLMKSLPVIGLMLGDMTGIGPEISVKLLASGVMKPHARIAVIGDARVFELGCEDARTELAWRRYKDVTA